jgi:hypothetical protein
MQFWTLSHTCEPTGARDLSCKAAGAKTPEFAQHKGNRTKMLFLGFKNAIF